MGWDRQTRGLSQSKLGKPNIKQNLPLPKDGDNGDMSIRNVTAGVFSFFKALGTWFKVFNNKNHMIPDKPNTYDIGSQHTPWRSLYLSNNSLHIGNTKAEQTSISTDGTELKFKDSSGKLRNIIGRETGTSDDAGTSNDYVTKIGKDSTANAQGYLALGSGVNDNGGFITGAVNLAKSNEAGYKGLRCISANPSNSKIIAFSIIQSLAITVPNVSISSYAATGATYGGSIDIKESDANPPSDPTAGYISLFAKSDGLYIYQDSTATNISTAFLPLAGGTMTGTLEIVKTSYQLGLNYDGSNYSRFTVVSNGSTTLHTVGSGTTDSDIKLDADGAIILDAANGRFIANNNNTEFSAANSSYAGMILGYTKISNTTASPGQDVIVIGNSFVTLQTAQGTNVSIVFKAPPSGNIEISLSANIYASSKEVAFSLSDNATYNELHAQYTYDFSCWKSDETDRDILDVRWALTSLTPGTSYTYYIGAKASSASAYMYHGSDRVGAHSPPIIVKAVALPATITTGG